MAKSLTTLLTPFAAERGLRAIWLTPLLHRPEVVDGLRARRAPALLAGGTDDETWDGALAHELADQVLELPGADHSLDDPVQLPELIAAVRAFA